jgi:large subunit ribosomal protein L18
MIKKHNNRKHKKIRIRKKISGTQKRPRLAVYRSLKQMHVQLVDDLNGVSLTGASTLSNEIKDEVAKAKNKVDQSKLVGSLIAKKAKEKGIDTVVFDRSGYHFHGRVRAVAEGAREGGLKF